MSEQKDLIDDYGAELASITDRLNTALRECNGEEAKDYTPYEIKRGIDRLVYVNTRLRQERDEFKMRMQGAHRKIREMMEDRDRG